MRSTYLTADVFCPLFSPGLLLITFRFHLRCVGLTKKAADKLDNYTCEKCSTASGCMSKSEYPVGRQRSLDLPSASSRGQQRIPQGNRCRPRYHLFCTTVQRSTAYPWHRTSYQNFIRLSSHRENESSDQVCDHVSLSSTSPYDMRRCRWPVRIRPSS